MPWRTGVASIDPEPPPRSLASARPVGVEAPPGPADGGNGSSSENVERGMPTTGPISTNAVSRTRLPARRRVTSTPRASAPVRRLGEPQLEALGEEHELVEKSGAAGRRRRRPRAASRIRTRLFASSAFRFSNLPRSPAAAASIRTSCRDRPSSLPGRREDVRLAGRLDGEREHPPARRTPRPRGQPPRPAPARAPRRRRARPCQRPARRSDAEHQPAGPGQEVLVGAGALTGAVPPAPRAGVPRSSRPSRSRTRSDA